MALQAKMQAEVEEDEDIEALRWAALQTLKQRMSAVNAQDASTVGTFLPKKETGIGVPRPRHARNDGYHRHRINSNLITIVPTLQVPPLGSEKTRTFLSRSNLQSQGSISNKFNNSEDQEDENKQVSTKFTRFDDSSEESSFEESEDENSSSDEVNVKDDPDPEPDPDILVMKDVDENSLDRLMDQLEQEMNDDLDNGTKSLPDGNSGTDIDGNTVGITGLNDLKKDCKRLAPRSPSSSPRKKVKKNNEKDVNSVTEFQSAPVSITNNGVTSQSSSASEITSKDKLLNIVDLKSCSRNSNSKSPVSPINMSPGHHNRKSRSMSPKKSPHKNSKPNLEMSRNSRSISPLPKHYYSPPRSPFHSKSPQRSRSLQRSNSPYRSWTPRHSRSPRHSSSLCHGRSPYHSRSPCHSRTSRRSRSVRRSKSPFNSRSYRRSRSRLRSRSPHHSSSPRQHISRSPALPRSPRSARNSRSPPKNSKRHYPSPIRYSHQRYVRNLGTFSPRRESHSPRTRHVISPRRSVSLKRSVSPRRSTSPRQSISPRLRRLSPRRPISPRRSPVASRRQFSPRRQSLSPRFRRHSKSPVPRHPHSPRNRRSVSPRRKTPVSFRKRYSPSPVRRNQSLVRRFSPSRRSPSVPRRCSSHSRSRSPRRCSPMRERSPIPARSFPRSPSPRRRISRSPIGRTGVRRSSPKSRKLSPWPISRQGVTGRFSPCKPRSSPTNKRKSVSPQGRQKMSTSPSRNLHEKLASHTRGQSKESRFPPSPSVGDSHKVTKESRSSHSLQSSPAPDVKNNLNSRSPSVQHKSSSSSLSLSPSPERNPADDLRRVKSPLRMAATCVEFKTNASVDLENDGKEGNTTSPSLTVQDVTSRKHSKSVNVNKESRSKYRKKIHNKVKDLVVQLAVPVDNSENKSRTNSLSSENKKDKPSFSVMEARRRKFESSEPVELSNKRIRLKPVVSKEITCENQSQTISATSEFQRNDDELDVLLDLELDNDVNFWSSEDSLSDTESRFKSFDKREAASGEVTKVGVLPFAKLLDQTSSSLTSGSREPNVSKTINKIPEEKSRRDADRSSRGLKQRVRASDSSASSRDLREQKSKEVYDSSVEALSSGVTNKTVDFWNTHLEVQNSSNSKLRNDTNTDLSCSEEERKPDKSVEHSRSREGDLRAELSRRRAERLTKIGSLQESLPSRLVRSAFKDAVGTKNFKKIDRNVKHESSKKSESSKGPEKSDGRRVLVLKSTAVERHIPSISVTIPKEGKHKELNSPLQKLPVRMRLGLPTIASNDRETGSSRRRGSRKVKLKRNVTVTSSSSSGDKV